MFRYVGTFIILTVLGILYEKYKLKFVPDEELEKYDLIKKYLLNSNENLGGKPILWVHTTHNINARHWLNFGSRNTLQLNQPYILSCIETIVRHCSDSFHICLIDDSSFMKLIPQWEIDVPSLAEPVRSHIRALAMSKLFLHYGGMTIPDSTIVLTDLIGVYRSHIGKGMFVGETLNRNVTSTYCALAMDNYLMGCEKEDKNMKKFSNYLELLVSRDYTNEIEFEGNISNFLNKMYNQGEIEKINGSYFGQKDESDKDVTIDRLMGNTYIQFKSNMVSIIIPQKMLLKRQKYGWFVRLSQNQLKHCDNIAAKWLIIGQN